MVKPRKFISLVTVGLLCAAACAVGGCRQPASYRREADKVAADIIRERQTKALGRTEPFTIETPEDTLRRRLLLTQNLPHSGAPVLGSDKLERPKHWPEKELAPHLGGTCDLDRCITDNGVLRLTLVDALQVAAANNRDYQGQKEDVFRSALDLDLEEDEFRNTFAGALATLFSVDTVPTVTGFENSGSLDWSKKLKAGATITAGLAIDLVKLMTGGSQSSLGISADASITIPLLRGAGRHIFTEPLTQAQRNVIYEIWSFERYKKTLAVRVASEYLSVLQRLDRIKVAEDNYRRLMASVKREQMLAKAGRRRQIDVDRTKQAELSARQSWISEQQNYASRLDSFKNTLGLPTDAKIELDREELTRLVEAGKQALAAREPEQEPPDEPNLDAPDRPTELKGPTREGGGPLEMDPEVAVRLALARRLDLRTAHGQVYDAQRGVIVAADALRAGLDLTVSGSAGEGRSLGSAGSPNAWPDPTEGSYAAGLGLDLPLERTSQRNTYRESYISLERAIRSAQQLEDSIKLEVRNALRQLLNTRERYKIQVQAVGLAERRMENVQMLLDAGRAETFELLDAQEALVNAQNDLTDALVTYRVTSLELQRDLSVLEVNEKGLWREYEPVEHDRE